MQCWSGGFNALWYFDCRGHTSPERSQPQMEGTGVALLSWLSLSLTWKTNRLNGRRKAMKLSYQRTPSETLPSWYDPSHCMPCRLHKLWKRFTSQAEVYLLLTRYVKTVTCLWQDSELLRQSARWIAKTWHYNAENTNTEYNKNAISQVQYNYSVRK